MEEAFRREFNGIARIQEAMVDLAKSLAEVKLTPQDLANPVSFQLAFSRLYETIINVIEKGGKKSFVAEVRFKDSLGNIISFAVDLGENPPPFSTDRVRARIIVELYEEL